MAFGFNKSVLDSMGMSSDALISQGDEAMTDEFKDKPWADSVKSSEWTKDGFSGTQISFEGVPLDEFNKTILPTLDLYSQDEETTSTFSTEESIETVVETKTVEPDPKYPPVQIKRVDDSFQIAGVIDFSKERSEEMSDGSVDSGMSDEEADIMAAGGGAELSLTFPGPVTSDTGKVEGNTVTWDVALGERSEVTATASAVKGEPVPAAAEASEKKASNWIGLVAMLVGALLLAGAGAAGVLFWRGRRDIKDEANNEFESAPMDASLPLEVVVSDDYAVDLDAPVQQPYSEPALEQFAARPFSQENEQTPESQGRRRAPVPVDSEPTVPATTPQRIEPGWYPTADGSHLRWHDGTNWTEHTRFVG